MRPAVLCCADAWSVHSCSCKCAELYNACVHKQLAQLPYVDLLASIAVGRFCGMAACMLCAVVAWLVINVRVCLHRGMFVRCLSALVFGLGHVLHTSSNLTAGIVGFTLA